jgi:hypothetical protein
MIDILSESPKVLENVQSLKKKIACSAQNNKAGKRTMAL